MTTSDNGNSGSGGALTDSAPITINVTAVNDAPVPSSTLLNTDPWGAALPASYSSFVSGGTFSAYPSDGTYTMPSGTTVTLTGGGIYGLYSYGQLTNAMWIGAPALGSVNTETFTFSKAISKFTVQFNASNPGDIVRIKVNGAYYALSASEVSGATINTDSTSTYLTETNPDALDLITVSSVAGTAGITSFSVQCEGGGNGDLFLVTAYENSTIQQPSATASATANQVVGSNFSDADNNAFNGVVITNAGTTTEVSTYGNFQYSKDNGSTWINLAAGLTDSTAVYLAKTDLIRFMPISTNTSTFKQDLVMRLVDSTATGLISGSTVDVSGALHGGSTAYSANTVTIHDNTPPVVIDLNQDGIISYGQVIMDVNGDGVLDVTRWAGVQDGVLVWDKYADGIVHDNSQYAFNQYGAVNSTDLQGLAVGFDSNHDSVLDASDAKFAEFAVWQDANQNGVSDAGEVRSLADVGITSITLSSDGVVRHPVDGVSEAGHTTATMVDGSSVLVADAGFSFSSLAYKVDGDRLSLSGENMNLDLSSLLAVHKDVTSIDLSGSGANSVKLTLNDVMDVAESSGLHQLTLIGDADDSVTLNITCFHWAHCNPVHIRSIQFDTQVQ